MKKKGLHHRIKHERVWFGVFVVLLVFQVYAVFGVTYWQTFHAFSMAITPENIIRLTNEARVREGRSVLNVNAALTAAAQAKADDMLATQTFSHTSPSGTTHGDLIRAQGYTALYSGENLAVHFETAEDVEQGWQASPGHRANVLNPRYVDTGVGISSGRFEGAPTIFVVQLFAAPAPSNVRPATVAEPEFARTELSSAPDLPTLYGERSTSSLPMVSSFLVLLGGLGLIFL